YFFTWKALTVGLGGEVMVARATSTPSASAIAAAATAGQAPLRSAEERLVSASPQLSLNFGSAHGWSYISGGIGRSQLSLHPSADPAGPADAEVLTTFNYGAGARWFIKPRLAFSFDVRFYPVHPSTTLGSNPGSFYVPVLTIGAGISVK